MPNHCHGVGGTPGFAPSFTLLTLNADRHPVMSFHAPGDEKRSVVLLSADGISRWLHADARQATDLLCAFDPARVRCAPDPRPARARAAPAARVDQELDF
jgi:hypothetical protein